MKKIITITFLSASMMFAVAAMAITVTVTVTPISAYAQEAGGGATKAGGDVITKSAKPFPTLTNPLGENDVTVILFLIVDLAVTIGIILATIMIIYAGFRLVWARGNTTELEAAKNLFFAVIIGLAILIAAKAIVKIVRQTLINANVVDPKVFEKPTFKP